MRTHFGLMAFAAIAALFATWVQMFFSLEHTAHLPTVPWTLAVIPVRAWLVSPLVFLVLLAVMRPSAKGAALAALIFIPVNLVAVTTLIPALLFVVRGVAGL
jgi:hypothetical protein